MSAAVPAFYFDWNANDNPDYGESGASGKLFDDLLMFTCPGRKRFRTIKCTLPKTPNSWEIVSGSLDDVTTLTLAPSINCVGCCGWHGFLRNGIYESC